MTISDIRKQPVSTKDLPAEYAERHCHESVFRAWHIVRKVKYLLESGVPARIVLKLIAEMEMLPAEADGGESGPVRWASQVGVCGQCGGMLFPGASQHLCPQK